MLVAILKILVAFFAITVSAHEIVLQLDTTLKECDDECGCNQNHTIESCVSLNDKDGTITFFSGSSSLPSTSKICKECYNLTRIINIIQEESKESFQFEFQIAKMPLLNLLRVYDKGFLGLVSMNQFYLITVENDNGLFFEKYKFHELKEDKNNGAFHPTSNSSFKPCSTEVVNFLYFSTFKNRFTIADTMKTTDLVIQNTQKFIDYSTYLYYTSIFLLCITILILCIKNRDLIRKYKLKQSTE
ncbi:uncharacterized protein VICG_01982 [Vittaforma corneae ATCC 50505]|uniref:GOLD domain-containing protein n=1 Tax=Vittaforma corneae (strain ATCC 50505) TaxID=993615 RepID=L2GKX5_VITCO|nr:uncharacterized protein VICG_01982 [Vittaforma corneae ATCC 50505]ELA40952.1 hypothetical protein VICG_01982 [Vittaforma corneae ATCC 50505]